MWCEDVIQGDTRVKRNWLPALVFPRFKQLLTRTHVQPSLKTHGAKSMLEEPQQPRAPCHYTPGMERATSAEPWVRSAARLGPSQQKPADTLRLHTWAQRRQQIACGLRKTALQCLFFGGFTCPWTSDNQGVPSTASKKHRVHSFVFPGTTGPDPFLGLPSASAVELMSPRLIKWGPFPSCPRETAKQMPCQAQTRDVFQLVPLMLSTTLLRSISLPFVTPCPEKVGWKFLYLQPVIWWHSCNAHMPIFWLAVFPLPPLCFPYSIHVWGASSWICFILCVH